MKVAVLTTETTHHAYFVRGLAGAVGVELVVVERNSVTPTFETHHPFEDERDAYERNAWFGGRPPSMQDLAPTLKAESINADQVVAALNRVKPDVVVVFGTGRLLAATIRTCSDGLLNLHGGDPQEYRGLDSHLWAIYHRDFGGLVTTLHCVNEELDDGDIVLQAPLPICRDMRLSELRHRNTEVCLQLALTALDGFARTAAFAVRPQQRRGRYYSFMPAVLKEVCRKKFEHYTSTLS